MDMTALYKLSCGLYVITTVDGGRGVGCVVNTVTQVTAEPVQVMVAINKENFTAGAVQRAGRFAVSVLTESAPMELIGRFGFRSSKDEDKFEGLKAVAVEQRFREPILGNLFRDGGEALAPQLDGFIEALTNAPMAPQFHSRKGMDLVENVKWIAKSAYGVPEDRILLKDGFIDSLTAARGLCREAGVSLDDLAVVVVKSPATMTDDDTKPEEERTVTLKKVEVHAGAGVVHVNLTTSLTTPMPKIV